MATYKKTRNMALILPILEKTLLCVKKVGWVQPAHCIAPVRCTNVVVSNHHEIFQRQRGTIIPPEHQINVVPCCFTMFRNETF